jgi:hypothetical protein
MLTTTNAAISSIRFLRRIVWSPTRLTDLSCLSERGGLIQTARPPETARGSPISSDHPDLPSDRRSPSLAYPFGGKRHPSGRRRVSIAFANRREVPWQPLGDPGSFSGRFNHGQPRRLLNRQGHGRVGRSCPPHFQPAPDPFSHQNAACIELWIAGTLGQYSSVLVCYPVASAGMSIASALDVDAPGHATASRRAPMAPSR